MLKILKQGKKMYDPKRILKFKCEVCKCIFKTDDYRTNDFWIVNQGWKREYQIDCPNCGVDCSLFTFGE